MLFPHGLAGVVFDCDGVLLDSRASNILYYNLILQELGLPALTREQEEYVHMHTVYESLAHIVPPDRIQDLRAASQKVDYAKRIAPALSLTPGVKDCLERLRGAGLLLAVYTNRTTHADAVLERLGIRSFFSIVMTAAKAAPKPDPEGAHLILWEWDVPAGQVAMVGDSVLDQSAARGAGMRFVAFANPELDADAHAESFPALWELFRPEIAARTSEERR